MTKKQHRLPGRTRREFAHRLPRGVSGLRAAAMPHLRGCIRRGAERPGRSCDDPDRELDRGPRCRHPSSDAEFGLHIIGEYFLPIASTDGTEGRDAADDQDRAEPCPCARPMPQDHPRARPQGRGRRRYRGRGAADRRSRGRDPCGASRRGSPPISTGSTSSREDIEDEKHNTTRFVVLSRKANGRRAIHGSSSPPSSSACATFPPRSTRRWAGSPPTAST